MAGGHHHPPGQRRLAHHSADEGADGKDAAAHHVQRALLLLQCTSGKYSIALTHDLTPNFNSFLQELAFAALKLGELNPERLPTGKKSLSNVASIVGTRLAAIPRSVAVRYWHQAVLGLYGYLYYERL